jgi:DNA-binding transcriptional regulator YhcF (GntR family)
MESIERKHFVDIAKGLALYVLSTLSELEEKDNFNPDYLTEIVIGRLRNIDYNKQSIMEWLDSESLYSSVSEIFKKNL